MLPDIYHMNEVHSIGLNFHLIDKFKSRVKIKKRVVFTVYAQ
jgi:glycogen phosphorylase